MDDYKAAIRMVTILNYIAAHRNFIDPRKNQFKFILSWIWNTISILMISAIPFLVVMYIINIIISIAGKAFNIESMSRAFQYVINILGYTSSMIIGLYQSKNVLTMEKQIDEVDEILKKLGTKIDYSDLFRHVKIVGSLLILIALIMCGICTERIINEDAYLSLPIQIFIIFNFVYMTNTQSIVLYDYNTVIFWLGSRFKMINELIETLLLEKNQINDKKSDEVVIFKPNNNLRNRLRIDNSLSDSIDAPNSDQGSTIDEKLRSLQQIRFLHLQVCNVSKMVNNIFNSQILIYTLTMLIYVSVIIYSMYMDFRRSHDFVQVMNPMYLYLLDSIIAILKIPAMSYDCEYAMRQASRTIDLIHSCPLYRESAELKDETLQFLWQISYMQLEDTKSVHYILNYNFVRDCLYFVITYLVIMIQLTQNLIVNDSLSDATRNETSTFQTILLENTSLTFHTFR